MGTIRWGILGCGEISRHFARALRSVDDARIEAVAARDGHRAAAFADEIGCGKAYEGYDGLLSDAAVDIVYVATVTRLHCAHVLACLAHGKPVLCEKPLSANGSEAVRMADAARQNGLFLMEAMWTRFLPANLEARRLIDTGAIGRPRIAYIDLGVTTPWTGTEAYTDPSLCGGTLIGAGVYAVAQAFGLLGRPTETVGLGYVGETGTDEHNAMLFRHPGGALSLISSSLRVTTRNEAAVYGEDGSLIVPLFQDATQVIWRPNGREEQALSFPHNGANGFVYEIREVHRCLRAGRTESPLLPLDESVAIMKTDQALRNSWGVYYPGDRDE